MRDSYLLLTPLLVLGVLGLVRFVGCDIVFHIDHVDPPPPPPLEFVTDETLGTSRHDFSGFAGMAIDIGSKSLKVRDVQRYCISPSTGDHRVAIIDAATGMQVPTAVAIVSTLGKPDGFVPAPLNSTVTLTAGTRYYIVSEEVDQGDFFFDNDTAVTHQTHATVVAPVYFDQSVQQWVMMGDPDKSYGPVNFSYDPV